MSGRVIVPAVPPVASPLPSGSCLVVFVQEDIECQGINCVNPILGETRINDPQISSSKSIEYSFRFKSVKSGLYTMRATLNMGWCKTDDESIRKGDYHNDYAHSFELRSGMVVARKDIYITQYGIPSSGDMSRKSKYHTDT